ALISTEDSTSLIQWHLKSNALQQTAPDSAIYFAKKQLQLSYAKEIPTWQGKALYNLGTGFFYTSKYDSATIYLQKALVHPQSKDGLKARCYHNLGLIYSQTGKFDLAMDAFDKGIALYRITNVPIGVSMIHNMKGSMLIRQDRYDEAISQYLKALEIIDSMGDESRRYKLIGNIGGTFEQVGAFEKALDYYEQAKAGATALNDRFTIAYIERTKGGLFTKMNRFEDARTSLELARMLFDSVQNVQGKIEVEGLYGNLLKQEHNLEHAVGYYLKALELSQSINDPSKILIYLANVAEYHQLKGNQTLAIEQFKQVATIADTLGMDHDLANAQKQLAVLYRSSGQLENALSASDAFMVTQQTIFDKEKAKALAKAQTQFETSEKERLILELTKEKAETDIKNAKQRSWIIAIFMLLIIAFISSVLFYHLSKIRQQAAADKSLLLDEMHHRTKNNLAIVESLLRVQEDHNPTNVILEQSRSRIKSIALVHQILYQDKEQDEAINLQTYLNALIDQIAESTTANIELVSNIQIEEPLLDVQKAIPFCLIANELIVNAIQHAFPNHQSGTVCLTLCKTPKQELLLEVQDTGVGFASGFEEGYGWRLVRGLSKQLKGKIETDFEQGTCVRLLLPYQEPKPVIPAFNMTFLF
ncbi:MAG: tetratricopeptide repeat protein, partial [Bacteroidota bacterium]